MPIFADYRLKKELETLDILNNCTLTETQPLEEKFHRSYKYTVNINDGIFANRKFNFYINIFKEYPFKPPKVKCKEKIYHPNFDEQGNVCMNIIREDWTSAMGLQIITLGLYTLFFEIKGEDALNVEAGDLILNDFDEYVRRAKEWK